MSGKKKRDESIMEINWAQQKAISNPFRSRLIGMLYEHPMTPKQAADALDKNPGTTYYHIQQLMKHGILEVDHVDTNKGVVEKYYKAKAISFRNPEQLQAPGEVDNYEADLYLSEELLEELTGEMYELLLSYGKKSYQERNDKTQKAYHVRFQVNESKEEE
ncbi:ArsR/SmtB family transcription factor [Salisediminibacterium beveridgei]|uniref:Transcriptional Regulator n=1 Tax=Salisediminibacterium beveridgei TaxID=632773 RepID=A0A1D7QZH7_9BACI|nr:winged helix-turn-helix domain-containing protein [Salisediminibacterium beveridgei]AOM84413.1 Transcriptional Regulator [Salisediminibacterium beveridgei]